MIESSVADVFMDKIYELVERHSFKTENMVDVVLLMGGSGSGKSTTLNMIAGSVININYNNDTGDF
jgi:ABC-type Fe3+/spermidine/putrescine transport system ATPase subunit